MQDLDHFKSFNDTHGHAAGDALLCALARLLRERTRDADIACRYGGEEFIIVMPGSPLHSAQHRADEIRQQFARSIIEMDGAMLQATISLGLSAYPAHGKNSEDLIKKALKTFCIIS